MRISHLRALCFVGCALSSHSALAGDPYYYSKPNVLIGADKVTASANYGAGVVIGDIDTGIVPWVGFSSAYNGRGVDNIDTVNSGVCLGGTCTAGIYTSDAHGHGTFTASQMVGGITSFDAKGNGITGVASASKLVAVQVLNAQGSGTLQDVSNGIKYAADHGAQVLNLSLGPNGTAAQQVSFYQGMADAINYAASKNVYIVFAGGNSDQALVGNKKMTGFTDAALQRLMFVGATNSKLKIASYSNTPGTGSFTSTTNKSTAYKNMWVMADGGDVNWFGQITDPVWGASNLNTTQCASYSCISQSVGTSMAAPQGTASIALLLARWPVLITNGNAARIIEQTATDLGTKGIDTTYGSGFINLVKAFQPSGTLLANTATGGTVAVSSSSTSGGGAVARGALGSLPGVANVLRDYTVFDEFERDFALDLSGLITPGEHASSVVETLGAPEPVVSSAQFTDGSRLNLGSVEDASPAAMLGRASGLPGNQNVMASFTDAQGTTMAVGSGSFPASASFADTLWGASTPAAQQAYALGASNALLNLAGGGQYLAYGTPISDSARIAVAWAETQHDENLSGGWMQPNAQSFGTGITQQLTPAWKAGITLNLLDEEHGLLGTTYDVNGPLHFGSDNRNLSVGATSAIALGRGRDLLLDAAVSRSEGAELSGSIISSLTPIYAYSLGASLTQRDALQPGDGLSLSVRSPLQVFSGSATIATTSVDAFGNATTASRQVGLTPDGHELDLSASYGAPLGNAANWNVSVNLRNDADNVAGATEANVLFAGKLRF